MPTKCRVVIQWLSDALQEYSKRLPADPTLTHMKECTSLGKKVHKVEHMVFDLLGILNHQAP